MTLLETIRKHRREVTESVTREMKFYSDKFLFNHVDGICLAAYQVKNKNPVMLFSSNHADTLVAADETKKPVMILDYNNRKEGVDMPAENLERL